MYPMSAAELPDAIKAHAYPTGQLLSIVHIPQLEQILIGTKMRIHKKNGTNCVVFVLTLRETRIFLRDPRGRVSQYVASVRAVSSAPPHGVPY